MTHGNPAVDGGTEESDNAEAAQEGSGPSGAAHYDGLREPERVDWADDAPLGLATPSGSSGADQEDRDATNTTDQTTAMSDDTTTDDSSTDTTTNDAVLFTDGGQDPEAWTPQQDAPTYGGIQNPTKMNWVDAIRAGFDDYDSAAEAMGKSRTTASRNLRELRDRDDAPVTMYKVGKTKRFDYDPSLVDGNGANGSSQASQGSTQQNSAQGGQASTQQNGASQPSGPDGRMTAEDFPKPVTAYPGGLVDRRHEYDFANEPAGKGGIPNVPEYHPSGDEMLTGNMYANAVKDLDTDAGMSEPFALQLEGDTGTGKTHMAKALAQEHNASYFEVALNDVDDAADLVGFPMVKDGAPDEWIDGKLVKCLLATQRAADPNVDTEYDMVVLALDEVNRAPPSVRKAFMAVLDSRCAINLERRGGEVVAGRKDALVVVSTRNPHESGRMDYDTYKMDAAQQDRLGDMYSVDYLGRDRPDKAVDMLVERQGVTTKWARKAVEAANNVREAAYTTSGGAGAFGGGGGGGGNSQDPDVDGSDVVDKPFPTRSLLKLARKAWMHDHHDHPNANMKAIDGVVANGWSGEARDVVEQMFADKLNGVDVVAGNGNGVLEGASAGNGGGA